MSEPAKSQPTARPVGDIADRGEGALWGITLVLNGLSLCVALLLLFALFFTWGSVGEISNLERRLGELQKFETRMVGRMDSQNNGFHSQFDEVNNRIANLAAEVDKARAELARVAAELKIAIRDLEASNKELPVAAAREVTIAAPPPAAAVPAPPARREPPVASSQFQRTVSPDGKVTYSRVP